MPIELGVSSGTGVTVELGVPVGTGVSVGAGVWVDVGLELGREPPLPGGRVIFPGLLGFVVFLGVDVGVGDGEMTMAASLIGCPGSSLGISSMIAAVPPIPPTTPTTIEAITMTAVRGTSPSSRQSETARHG
ncbi:hypothetical protein BH11ACT2_BH11ACT2_18400 [soil metagenome]